MQRFKGLRNICCGAVHGLSGANSSVALPEIRTGIEQVTFSKMKGPCWKHALVAPGWVVITLLIDLDGRSLFSESLLCE